MNNLQALVDGLAAQWQKDRAKSQMTLGEMITALEALPKDAKVQGIGDAHSYRGYYCDLAFEPQEQPRPVCDILAECRAAMGRTFEGYKGGDFVMGERTPVWVAAYGCSGRRIMSLDDDGVWVTQPDDE